MRVGATLDRGGDALRVVHIKVRAPLSKDAPALHEGQEAVPLQVGADVLVGQPVGEENELARAIRASTSGSSGALRTHNRPATEGMHVSLRADLGHGPDGKVDWEHAAFEHPEPFSWTQFCLEDLVSARAEGRCGSALPVSVHLASKKFRFAKVACVLSAGRRRGTWRRRRP